MVYAVSTTIEETLVKQVEEKWTHPDHMGIDYGMDYHIIQAYLQVKLLRRLEGIEQTLENIEGQLVSMNPLYK